MIGAIIGDIVGSRFEWKNHKNKDFELFHPDCRLTDDSIMSLAIAKTMCDCGKDYDNLSHLAVKNMQEIGRQYPGCGFGDWFYRWVHSDNPEPYNSFGNGAAMRVSACGIAANSLEMAKYLSRKVTEVTHNHPEGLKGAEATAVAVYLIKEGWNKSELREHIQKHYYPLNFTLDEIRKAYQFDVTCQGTVPQAIVAFLESDSFEDAVRNAISIGGDSDTLGAITGSIAGEFYTIPPEMSEQALTYLDQQLRGIQSTFEFLYVDICHESEKFKRRNGIKTKITVNSDSDIYTNLDIVLRMNPNNKTSLSIGVKGFELLDEEQYVYIKNIGNTEEEGFDISQVRGYGFGPLKWEEIEPGKWRYLISLEELRWIFSLMANNKIRIFPPRWQKGLDGDSYSLVITDRCNSLGYWDWWQCPPEGWEGLAELANAIRGLADI